MLFIRAFFMLMGNCVLLCAAAQCTSVFPYHQDFETGNGGWTTGGTATDWAWGQPGKSEIGQAASGSNCWITGGLTASFYNLGERSYVQSPCFNFSSLQYPYISFNIYWESEKTYDGANLQYSTDNGITWANVGSFYEVPNCITQQWYNTPNITNLAGLAQVKEGWSGNVQTTTGSCQGGNGSHGWVNASHCLGFLAGQPSVIFRFAFGAGTSCNNYDGIAFDDVHIAETAPNSGDFTFYCSDTAVVFTATTSQCPDTLLWDFGDGTKGAGANVNHHYAAGGAYSVTLTARGPCNAPAIITKTITIPRLTVSTSPVTCAGVNNGTAVATVTGSSGPFTYTWSTSPPQTGDTATNLAAGSYTVTVTGNGTCALTATAAVDAAQAITLAAAPGADTCGGGKGNIRLTVAGAVTPFQFVWSDGSFLNPAVNLGAGTYAVTVTDANNCTASATAVVQAVSGLAITYSDINNVSCYGSADGSVTAAVTGGLAPYIFSWSNNRQGATLTGLNDGAYRLTVTDGNNCVDSSMVTIAKEVCRSYVFFPTGFSPNNDGVNDFFKPKYSADLRRFYLRVYNRWGELVYETTDVNDGWDGTYKDTPQPISVFAWVAEYSFLTGEKHTDAGTVTLVR